ncbi:MAG TPA: glutaredoxin family protein [Steroidobacteraceae bacterium]|nr:glutaredoxin family protein [Steroidobacteraceae bacterium]
MVLSREGCHLCEDMLLALAELERTQAIPPVTVVDVDSDAGLSRQYGLKVPVLLLDGSVICHYTLNSKELLRLVGRGAAILPR